MFPSAECALESANVLVDYYRGVVRAQTDVIEYMKEENKRCRAWFCFQSGLVNEVVGFIETSLASDGESPALRALLARVQGGVARFHLGPPGGAAGVVWEEVIRRGEVGAAGVRSPTVVEVPTVVVDTPAFEMSNVAMSTVAMSDVAMSNVAMSNVAMSDVAMSTVAMSTPALCSIETQTDENWSAVQQTVRALGGEVVTINRMMERMMRHVQAKCEHIEMEGRLADEALVVWRRDLEQAAFAYDTESRKRVQAEADRKVATAMAETAAARAEAATAQAETAKAWKRAAETEAQHGAAVAELMGVVAELRGCVERVTGRVKDKVAHIDMHLAAVSDAFRVELCSTAMELDEVLATYKDADNCAALQAANATLACEKAELLGVVDELKANAKVTEAAYAAESARLKAKLGKFTRRVEEFKERTNVVNAENAQERERIRAQVELCCEKNRILKEQLDKLESFRTQIRDLVPPGGVKDGNVEAVRDRLRALMVTEGWGDDGLAVLAKASEKWGEKDGRVTKAGTHARADVIKAARMLDRASAGESPMGVVAGVLCEMLTSDNAVLDVSADNLITFRDLSGVGRRELQQAVQFLTTVTTVALDYGQRVRDVVEELSSCMLTNSMTHTMSLIQLMHFQASSRGDTYSHLILGMLRGFMHEYDSEIGTMVKAKVSHVVGRARGETPPVARH